VSAAAVVRFNQRAVGETGEPFFIRDAGLLDSALARPHNHWSYGEEDLAVLATALTLGIARNHPFGQGNKRTAFAAAEYFLFLNGYRLEAEDSEALADQVVALIVGDLDEAAFANLLRDSVQPL
jgi:death-on-curing protein